MFGINSTPMPSVLCQITDPKRFESSSFEYGSAKLSVWPTKNLSLVSTKIPDTL